MIPVDQTIYGAPYGNCFAACVASILEVPLGSIINVMWADNWLNRFNYWAGLRGFQVLSHPWNDGQRKYIETYHRDSYIIVGGPPDRPLPPGFGHACVYKGSTLVHDPHPERKGHRDLIDWTLIWLTNPSLFMSWHARANGRTL